MVVEATLEELEKIGNIIYLIENQLSKKCYIGQSLYPFYKRYRSKSWWKHLSNKELKQDVLDDGEENFKIFLLEKEISTPEKLSELELFHSQKYKCYYPKGYNKHPCGNKITRKTKEYLFRDINNNFKIIIIKDLNKFCFENNLRPEAMRRVASRLLRRHKNFANINCLSQKDLQKINNYNFQVYLKNPQGKVFYVKNLKQFCRDYKLDFSSMCKVRNGKKNHFLGWTLKDYNGLIVKKGERKKIYKVLSPVGIIYNVHNIYRFCKQQKLSYHMMFHAIKNKKEYKGYKPL